MHMTHNACALPRQILREEILQIKASVQITHVVSVHDRAHDDHLGEQYKRLALAVSDSIDSNILCHFCDVNSFVHKARTTSRASIPVRVRK